MKRSFFLVAFSIVAVFGRLDNWTAKKNEVSVEQTHSSPNVTSSPTPENPQARCYDSRLAGFLNSGLTYYSHDMGQLSKYLLDQIVRARMPGYWLVHSEMISGRRQGLDWQTLTTGDLFASTSRNGCYYHDTQTFVYILRY